MPLKDDLMILHVTRGPYLNHHMFHIIGMGASNSNVDMKCCMGGHVMPNITKMCHVD